jgi:hypothetical protein
MVVPIPCEFIVAENPSTSLEVMLLSKQLYAAKAKFAMSGERD